MATNNNRGVNAIPGHQGFQPMNKGIDAPKPGAAAPNTSSSPYAVKGDTQAVANLRRLQAFSRLAGTDTASRLLRATRDHSARVVRDVPLVDAERAAAATAVDNQVARTNLIVSMTMDALNAPTDVYTGTPGYLFPELQLARYVDEWDDASRIVDGRPARTAADGPTAWEKVLQAAPSW